MKKVICCFLLLSVLYSCNETEAPVSVSPKKSAKIELMYYGGQKDTITVVYDETLEINSESKLVDDDYDVKALGVTRFSYLSPEQPIKK